MTLSIYVDPIASIVADSYIGPGGCLIEAELGNIDATIESQFEEMKRALEEMVTAEDDETDSDGIYDITAAVTDGLTASEFKKAVGEEHLNNHLNEKNARPAAPKPAGARPRRPSSIKPVPPKASPSSAKPKPGSGQADDG